MIEPEDVFVVGELAPTSNPHRTGLDPQRRLLVISVASDFDPLAETTIIQGKSAAALVTAVGDALERRRAADGRDET